MAFIGALTTYGIIIEKYCRKSGNCRILLFLKNEERSMVKIYGK